MPIEALVRALQPSDQMDFAEKQGLKEKLECRKSREVPD
jgi:hypothetical protein